MVLPTITSITPNYGPIAGGTSLAIVGTGFSVGSPSVFFGSVRATFVTVNSDTSMTVVAPIFPSPTRIEVRVVTTAGTSVIGPTSLFYYLAQSPSGSYDVNNDFFDPAANYTVFGKWNFEQLPNFPGGSIDGATNLGTGIGLFAGVVGTDLTFYSLFAGSGINIAAPSAGNIVLSATGSGGTITSLTASTGITLTPNPITTTGIIGITATGVAAGSYSYANIVVNAQGQLTGATNGPIGANTQVLYNASGVISGSANMTFNATSNTLSVLNAAVSSLVLNGSTSGAVTLTTAAVTTSYPLILPPAQGTTGQVLYNSDGAGTLLWETPPGSNAWIIGGNTLASGSYFLGIASTGTTLNIGVGGSTVLTIDPALDFTVSGPGTVSLDGVAVNIGTGTPDINIGETASTITLLGALSIVSAPINLLDGLEFTNGASNTILFLPPSSGLTNSTYTLPVAAPAVSGYVLSATTAGVMSWVAQSGGGGVSTLTGNSGGAISPSGGNINVVGTTLYDVVGAIDTLTITPMSNAFPITPFVVGTNGGYSTVQSAINAAHTDGGGTVYIQAGSYVESLTFYDGVNIVGVPASSISGLCKITGVHTPPASGSISARNISFQTTSDVFDSAAAGSTTISLIDCVFGGVNGFIFDLVNWTGNLYLENCQTINSTSDGVLANGSGSSDINIVDCNVGVSTNTMTGGGFFTITSSVIYCPIDFLTGAGVQAATTLFLNVVQFSGSSFGTIDNCSMNPAQASLSVAGLNMVSTGIVKILNCTIWSVDSPAIVGNGTGLLSLFGINFVANDLIAGTLNVAVTGGYYPAGDNSTVGNVLTSNGKFAAPTFKPPSAGGTTWNSVLGGSQTLVADNAYAQNYSGLTTFTLPASANFGDEFQVQGNGAGGWTIAQNAGQNIQIGNVSSTVGVTGSVSSTNQYDVLKLVCTVANTTFNAEFVIGNLSVV